MAGRGTDIMLGGNAEFIAVTKLHQAGLNPTENPEEFEARWDEVFTAVKAEVSVEAEKVVAAGGLYVLGTERHESRRIDNQLRGRSGRQGDPGESRFYLSLQDDLMRLFNSGAAAAIMSRTGDDDMAIESKLVSRAIQSAQSQVEARNAEIRKNVLKYDDVLNRQREAIYGDRRQILEGASIKDKVTSFIERSITEVVNQNTGSARNSDDWDLEHLWVDVRQIFPVTISVHEVLAEYGAKITSADVTRELISDAMVQYGIREGSLGENAIRELERRVVLSVIDRRWRDHLYEMDYLKDGIGLRAMAQRDPLIEYQREGFTMFQAMMGMIREESVGFIFNLDVQVVPAGGVTQVQAPGIAPAPIPTEGLSYSAPNEDGENVFLDQSGRQPAAPQERLRPRRGNPPPPAQGGGAKGAFGQSLD
jgi:preprotein translocase subunit SecA